MLLDKIINTVFSFGAAVVIFGAWGKLENKDFGNLALTAGLLTETAIFCLYGLLEWIHRPQSATRVDEAERQEQPAPPSRAGSPVHKEDLEALTGSIKETANLLARIFRV
jgi:hypothetical protein